MKLPMLKTSKRPREYLLYSSIEISRIVKAWLFDKGSRHREMDRDILGFEFKQKGGGFHSMNVLHFLGLKKDFHGYFEGLEITEAIAIMESDSQDFTSILGSLNYINSIDQLSPPSSDKDYLSEQQSSNQYIASSQEKLSKDNLKSYSEILTILPISKAMRGACLVPLDQKLPSWLRGCLKDRRKKLYMDLFDPDLQIHELDKETIHLINMHMVDYIKISELPEIPLNNIENLDVFKISLNVNITNVLIRNNIKKVGDIGDVRAFQFKGVGALKFLTIYSALSVLSERHLLEIGSFDRQEDKISVELSLDQKKELLQNFKFKSELSQIRFSDPRFQNNKLDILKIIQSEDLNTSDNWLEALPVISSTVNYKEFEALLESLLKNIKRIEALPLDQQMQDYFKHSKLGAERHFEPLMQRLGLFESQQVKFTLEAAGKESNVTRERIRQLESKYMRLIKQEGSNKIFMPKLADISALIQLNLLRTQSFVESEILKKGFGAWNLERIIGAIELFNHYPNFSILEDLIYSGDSAADIRRILVVARKIVQYNGAVELNFLYGHISKEIIIDFDDVKQIIASKFDSIGGDWYFIKTSNNLIDSISQRMFNFSETQDIVDIREGHKKYSSQREQGFFRASDRTGFFGFITPPSEVIIQVLKKFNHQIFGTEVRCNNLDNNYLDNESADSQLFNFFKQRDFEPVTADEMKRSLVLEGDMPEASLFIYLSYKPFLKRYVVGVYGVAGHHPSEGLLESATNRREKNPTPVWEILENGNLCAKAKICNSVSSFVLTVPSSYLRFLNAEKYLILHNGETYADLKFSSGQLMHGAGKYLHNVLFCEFYDYIEFVFALDGTDQVSIQLITENEFIKSI